MHNAGHINHPRSFSEKPLFQDQPREQKVTEVVHLEIKVKTVAGERVGRHEPGVVHESEDFFAAAL